MNGVRAPRSVPWINVDYCRHDWGSAGSESIIAAATARVGGFSLTSDSRGASLLFTLEPGAYSATLSGRMA
jgi:hypothetical protein